MKRFFPTTAVQFFALAFAFASLGYVFGQRSANRDWRIEVEAKIDSSWAWAKRCAHGSPYVPVAWSIR